ncbi:MAG: ABC transporter ATP-binding protein [Planctomycetia bacterium]
MRHAFASAPTLRGLDLELCAGEVVGVLGASGCGKSTLLAAIAGLLPAESGSLEFEGELLPAVRESSRSDAALWSRVRGRGIGWIAQDPLAALHPLLTVEQQIGEGLEPPSRERCLRWMERCGLERPERFLARHPHQLSGGERQRVLLALCLAREPRLILADEPTSMLDPELAQAWMRVLIEEVRQRRVSLIFVTHEEQRIAPHADRLLRLEAGRLVPERAREWSYPARAPQIRGARLLRAHQLCVRRAPGLPCVLNGLDLELFAGEIVAVVGASGAGKTTLARTLAGLLTAESGTLELPASRSRARTVQLYFQDPLASFDPRRTLQQSLGDSGAARMEISRLCAELELGTELELGAQQQGKLDLARRPAAFSGGERARLALARMLLTKPDVLIYDEPLAALDGPLRVRMVEQLLRLRQAGAVAQLLVSHDRELVHAVADRVLQLKEGRLVVAQNDSSRIP